MNKVEFLSVTKVPFAERYDNFIGGKFVAPISGKYFDNASPVTGQVVCKIARSDAQDVEAALDAAHAAKAAWGRTSVAERAAILNRIADRMEDNLERLAIAETWDNGKPIRETRAADLPLAIDHFRYFAGVVRAQEGSIGEIDHDTIAYHFREPIGQSSRCAGWVARSCTMLPRPSFRRPWTRRQVTQHLLRRRDGRERRLPRQGP